VQTICAGIVHSAVDEDWIVQLSMQHTSSGIHVATHPAPSVSQHRTDYQLLLRQLVGVSKGNLATAHGRMQEAHAAFSDVQRAVLERSDRGDMCVFAQPPDVHPLTAATPPLSPEDKSAVQAVGEGHCVWDALHVRPVARATEGAPQAAAAGGPQDAAGQYMAEVSLVAPTWTMVCGGRVDLAGAEEVKAGGYGWLLLTPALACVQMWNDTADWLGSELYTWRFMEQQNLLRYPTWWNLRLDRALRWVGLSTRSSLKLQRDGLLLWSLFLAAVGCVFMSLVGLEFVHWMWFAIVSGGWCVCRGVLRVFGGYPWDAACLAADAYPRPYSESISWPSRIWSAVYVLVAYFLAACCLGVGYWVWEKWAEWRQAGAPMHGQPPGLPAEGIDPPPVAAPIPFAHSVALGAPATAATAETEGSKPAHLAEGGGLLAEGPPTFKSPFTRSSSSDTYPAASVPAQALQRLLACGIPLSPAAALLLHLGATAVLLLTPVQLQEIRAYLKQHRRLLRLSDVCPERGSTAALFTIPFRCPPLQELIGERGATRHIVDLVTDSSLYDLDSLQLRLLHAFLRPVALLADESDESSGERGRRRRGLDDSCRNIMCCGEMKAWLQRKTAVSGPAASGAGVPPPSTESAGGAPPSGLMPLPGDWYTWWVGLQVAAFLEDVVGVHFPPQLLLAVAGSALGIDSEPGALASRQYTLPLEQAHGVTCFDIHGDPDSAGAPAPVQPELGGGRHGLASQLCRLALQRGETEEELDAAQCLLQVRLQQVLPLCPLGSSGATPDSSGLVYDLQRQSVACSVPLRCMPNQLLPGDMRIQQLGSDFAGGTVNENVFTTYSYGVGAAHVQQLLFPFLLRLLGPHSAAMRDWVRVAEPSSDAAVQVACCGPYDVSMWRGENDPPRDVWRALDEGGGDGREGGGIDGPQIDQPRGVDAAGAPVGAAQPGGAQGAPAAWRYRCTVSFPVARDRAHWLLQQAKAGEGGVQSPPITLATLLQETRLMHVWRRWGVHSAPAAAQAMAARRREDPLRALHKTSATAALGDVPSLLLRAAGTLRGLRIALPEHLCAGGLLEGGGGGGAARRRLISSVSEEGVLGTVCGLQSAHSCRASDVLCRQFPAGLPWDYTASDPGWRMAHVSPAVDAAASVFGGFVSRHGLSHDWALLPTAAAVASSEAVPPTAAGVAQVLERRRKGDGPAAPDSVSMLARYAAPVLRPNYQGLGYVNWRLKGTKRLDVATIQAASSCPGGPVWPLPLSSAHGHDDVFAMWAALAHCSGQDFAAPLADTPRLLHSVSSSLAVHPAMLGGVSGCRDGAAADACFSLQHVAQRCAAARTRLGAPWMGWSCGGGKAGGDTPTRPSAAAAEVNVGMCDMQQLHAPIEYHCLRLVLPRLPQFGPPLHTPALEGVWQEMRALGGALRDASASDGGDGLLLGLQGTVREGGVDAVPQQEGGHAVLDADDGGGGAAGGHAVLDADGLAERCAELRLPTQWRFLGSSRYANVDTMLTDEHASGDSDQDWAPLPHAHELPLRPGPPPSAAPGGGLAAALQEAEAATLEPWAGSILTNRPPHCRHCRLLVDARGFASARLQWGRLLPEEGVDDEEAPHLPRTCADLLQARLAWLESPSGQAVAAKHAGVDLHRALCILSGFEQGVLLDMAEGAHRLQCC